MIPMLGAVAGVAGAVSNVVNAVKGRGGAGGASASASASGGGNDELKKTFEQAIKEASETMSISVTGQAQLNALRARPN